MTHVFKTTLAGNGDLYGWVEIDETGEVVQQSVQTYSSEADAEKAIRTIAPSSDIVEVSGVKNINSEANRNVNWVKPSSRDDNYGMNVVTKSVEDITDEEITAGSEKDSAKSSKKDEEVAKAKAKAASDATAASVASALVKAVDEQAVANAKAVTIAEGPAPVKTPVIEEHPNVAKMASMPVFHDGKDEKASGSKTPKSEASPKGTKGSKEDK